MNLEPFSKSCKLWHESGDIPSYILEDMQREADNVEDIAKAILKADRERKDRPLITDGLGAQMHTLIRELIFYRNTYDMKIVELRTWEG